MGKKVKKVFKAAVKVATLGAIDGSKGGWLGGTSGIANVLTLGTVGEGPLSNPLMPKQPDIPSFDSSGFENALNAQATAAQNANVDLGMENVADIELGGTASSMAGNRRRRKGSSGSGGVAASLGVRV